MKIVIEQNLVGTRLDKCVSVLDKDISRMAAQRLIEEGNIFINRRIGKGFI